MKPILSLILIALCVSCYAQTSPQTGGIKIADQKLYFLYQDKELEYFTHQNTSDSRRRTKAKPTFLLTDTYANLYFRWLNPIRYRYGWKDSTLTDERDKALADYFAKLAGQFGPALTGQDAKSQGAPQAQPGRANEDEHVLVKLPNVEVKLDIPNFTSPELNSLYLDIRNSGKLEDEDVTKINALTKLLEPLDKFNANNIVKAVDDLFGSLYAENDPDKVPQLISTANTKINAWNDVFTATKGEQDVFDKAFKSFEITDTLLNNVIKSTLSEFKKKVAAKTEADGKLVATIKPVAEILAASVKDPSTNQKGYYKIRDVDFDHGKVLQTTLIISEYEYKQETHSFTKKGDLKTVEMKFMRYDPVHVFVSSGIFYGSTTLRGYGVANENNAFTVKEDNINSNVAVTALFCNFSFGDSRYLSPLFQVGVDPTKKRPFLLLGGGFCIPSSKFAITGGPIWTWQQTLQKLTVGQTITSTTDLDKDIKYTFDMAPHGWYIGIQYNF